MTLPQKKITTLGAKRPKGFRGILSPCPSGAVAERLGAGGIVREARSDRRGFGESFPRAPLGLSRSGWGLEESCAKRVATEGFRESFPRASQGLSRSGWGLDVNDNIQRI